MRPIDDKCILRDPCDRAGVEGYCSPICPHYIAMHGLDGTAGKVAASGIPPMYSSITLSNSPVRQDQPEVYRAIDEYVKTFKRQFEPDPDGKTIKSLYLVSREVGTGKTTTASAIANEFQIRHYIGSLKRGLKPARIPVYFLALNEWQGLFNEFNRPNVPPHIAEPASHTFYEQQETAKNVPLLVLDDIGLRSASEAFIHELLIIINYRNTRELPTVYTSNVPIDELEKMYTKQLFDRVRDRLIVLNFKGGSKRGQRP